MTRKPPDSFIEKAQQNLKYKFKNSALLEEALTHKSYYHENRSRANGYNERLEFLGDSVIGLVIVEYLFLHERSYTEAVLAKIKSYIVSEPVFADIAKELSLGDCLLLGKGEKSTGGTAKKSILADTFEAVMGAVFLDAGFGTVRRIIHELFVGRIEAALDSGDFFDYKTELQEKSQSLFGCLPEYRVIKEQGDDHERIFTVAVYIKGKKLGVASGGKKKLAEMLAAKKAIKKIGESAEINEVDMDTEVFSL